MPKTLRRNNLAIRQGKVYVKVVRLRNHKNRPFPSITTCVFSDGMAMDGMVNLNGYWRPLKNPIYRD